MRGVKTTGRPPTFFLKPVGCRGYASCHSVGSYEHVVLARADSDESGMQRERAMCA
jgi:hypothetical protein